MRSIEKWKYHHYGPHFHQEVPETHHLRVPLKPSRTYRAFRCTQTWSLQMPHLLKERAWESFHSKFFVLPLSIFPFLSTSPLYPFPWCFLPVIKSLGRTWFQGLLDLASSESKAEATSTWMVQILHHNYMQISFWQLLVSQLCSCLPAWLRAGQPWEMLTGPALSAWFTVIFTHHGAGDGVLN